MDKTTKKHTVSVFTLGCKVNLYESRQIVGKLIEGGYDAFEGLKRADFFILNTCAVTNEAERKSRQAVARCLKLNPDAKIIVCGCAAQKQQTQFENENVVFVKGNADKTQILEQYLQQKTGIDPLPTQYIGGGIFAADNTKTRAFVKIQDGCDNFCNYCIVPYLRGRSRSRSAEDIISEIKTLQGFNEIVLTGVDISDYDKNGGGLAALFKSIGFCKSRIRLGSLEVRVVSQGLLSAMKDGNFCPHFHLSLQSGSDRVLKSMNRHYTTQQYLDAVELIRKNFENAGITTDVIVGYPTETEQCFEETCEFVQKVGFDDIHIFPFSKREGTVAASLAQLPQSQINKRAETLAQIKRQLKTASNLAQIGKTLSVLTEEKKGDFVCGYARNYTKVFLPQQNAEKNKIYEVFITKQVDDGVSGVII